MKRFAVSFALLLAVAGCTPAVDDSLIEQMEGEVRNGLAAQGNVKQVELNRENDDRMTGFAVVEPATAPGSEVRFTCTAQRQGETGAMFNWECVPPGAQPSADGGGEPAGDAGGGEGEEAADAGDKPAE